MPGATAEAVRLLEDAGWSNVGKANLHEFAYGITSQNPHYGTVPNPVAPGRVAGGSSGGCGAALAARLVDGALGSDTGGSIRIPAAWCGVVRVHTRVYKQDGTLVAEFKRAVLVPRKPNGESPKAEGDVD